MWNLVNCSMICENLYPQHPEPGKKEKFKMKSQFDVILQPLVHIYGQFHF